MVNKVGELMGKVKDLVIENDQLKYDNLRLLNALKASIDIVSGDFHLWDIDMSVKELINEIENPNVK